MAAAPLELLQRSLVAAARAVTRGTLHRSRELPQSAAEDVWEAAAVLLGICCDAGAAPLWQPAAQALRCCRGLLWKVAGRLPDAVRWQRIEPALAAAQALLSRSCSGRAALPPCQVGAALCWWPG